MIFSILTNFQHLKFTAHEDMRDLTDGEPRNRGTDTRTNYCMPTVHRAPRHNNTYSSNAAAKQGGAIYSTYCFVISELCSYVNNFAWLLGGAIFVSDQSLNSSSSFYLANVGHREGGAIYAGNCLSVFHNDSFTNNTADKGAALSKNHATASMDDCHFSFNTGESVENMV